MASATTLSPLPPPSSQQQAPLFRSKQQQEPDLLEDTSVLPPPAGALRASIKRSLELFIGNVGLKPADLPEASTKRRCIKVLDEYAVLDEPPIGPMPNACIAGPSASDQTSSQAMLESASQFPALTNQSSSTSLAIPIKSISGPASFTLPAPSSILSSTKPVGGSRDVLQHLNFRRAPRIPKVTEHPQWKLMRVISGHQGWVRCLAVDPTNEWFVSGGNDRLIKIWDLATGSLKLSLTGHINTIRAVEVSNRHPYLFSCGEDHMVKCWDLEYNKVIRHYHGHLSGVYSLALHPTLDILSTGGRDAVVRVWDMRTRQSIHVLAGHSGTVMSLASQVAEPQIISGSLDKMIRCWDLRTGRCSVVLTHHKKAIRSLALHPQEYTFCSASADALKIWKCPEGVFERNIDGVGSIMNSVIIKDDPVSAVVIGGSDKGDLHFWDWNSGRKFQTIETTPQPGSLSSEKAIFAVKLDVSETRLLTAECDKTIKVWKEDI